MIYYIIVVLFILIPDIIVGCGKLCKSCKNDSNNLTDKQNKNPEINPPIIPTIDPKTKTDDGPTELVYTTQITKDSIKITDSKGSIIFKLDIDKDSVTNIKEISEEVLDNFKVSKIKIDDDVINRGYILSYYKTLDNKFYIHFTHDGQETFSQKDLESITLVSSRNIKTFSGMFYESKLKDITIEKDFNTENAESMDFMFGQCHLLEKIDGLKYLNTKNVINMYGMFCDCKELQKIEGLKHFDTGNVIDMSYMFYGCTKLEFIDTLEKFSLKSVISIPSMFSECINLVELDLSSIELANDGSVDVRNFFDNCHKIEYLKINKASKDVLSSQLTQLVTNCNLKLREIDNVLTYYCPKEYK